MISQCLSPFRQPLSLLNSNLWAAQGFLHWNDPLATPHDAVQSSFHRRGVVCCTCQGPPQNILSPFKKPDGLICLVGVPLIRPSNSPCLFFALSCLPTHSPRALNCLFDLTHNYCGNICVFCTSATVSDASSCQVLAALAAVIAAKIPD